ncbi:hypothetical protein SAMN05216205_4938 [Pseudomonas mohnii]|uniref:PE family protein n=1 Tax=Pseudomonas mohnii TaxID=395600 RepID=A0ABY0YCH1_9PSED|nr:hypothetical protein [Pseudomonas mohnii]SED33354.1 hypothetical protein SAMN05216205_4938 [Pseudomonas mohnii]
MAVTAPTITPLPPAPLPTDAEAVFDAKAGVRLTAEEVMVVELNASFGWVATQVSAAEGYKNAAALSAQTATEQAAIASGAGGAAAEQVALAVTYANNAAASATAAESATGSIGNLALLHAVAYSF